MTSLPGFPPKTLYFVTNITQAKPGTVTLATDADSNAFAVAVGQTVTLSKLTGMYPLNGNRFIVGNLDAVAKTFDLYDIQGNPIDTTNYPAYVSGGEMNIISYPATAGNPPGLMYNNQGYAGF